jgi:hypothetical protein
MPARTGATTVHPFIPYEELPARQRRRIAIGAPLRTIATIFVVVAIYFRIPMDRAVTATTVIGLVIGVLALFAIIAWQIREIMRSEHPVVRAVEALAFAIPVYVLLFATIYFLMAHVSASQAGPDPPGRFSDGGDAASLRDNSQVTRRSSRSGPDTQVPDPFPCQAPRRVLRERLINEQLAKRRKVIRGGGRQPFHR